MAGKLEQQKQEKKQNLLTAALELFMENGVAKTSIDQIAGRAQVAKGRGESPPFFMKKP